MIIRWSLFIFLAALPSPGRSESCAENTCYGRGVCYDQSADRVTCVCQEGYTGPRCQFDKTTCSAGAGDPCVNGRCVEDHCECEPGWAGALCNNEDHCRGNPCRGHGVCISLPTGLQCLCNKGYTSDNCENNINECEVNPGICQNGGTCLDTDGSFQCQCPAGYDGKLCGYETNECDPDPCKNGGRCIDEHNGFRCECPAAFSGTVCEIEASDCGCVHGTCGEDENTCICDLGWSGYSCAEKITSCEFNPCQNGKHPTQISQCREYEINQSERKIHCLCAKGLTGDYCEREFDLCEQNPCRGQGDCSKAEDGGYTCSCYEGYAADNCEQDINECDELMPCKNGGECTNTYGSYYCNCGSGYGGPHCELNIDDCASEPCLNKGTCIDGADSYTCQCRDGFTGDNCEIDIDECENNNCPSYSVCVDKINHFLCICNKGYDGYDNCQPDENECTANLCKNGGTCVDLPGNFRCDCVEGYSGETCQFDNTACGVKPCLHGTCHLPENGAADQYTCTCDPGFSGVNCEHDIDDCADSPCQNGGSCVDMPNDFTCRCPLEWTGKDCTQDAQKCAHNPCERGGACTPTKIFPYYECSCQPGYTGDRCDQEIPCPQNICGEEGRCIQLSPTEQRCECERGWAGDTCQTKLEVCGARVCQNGGTCDESGRGCTCEPGWTGEECDRVVKRCEDDPCRNGGTCKDRFNGKLLQMFKCTCPYPYTGVFCEHSFESPCSLNPCQNSGNCSEVGDGFYKCTCPEGYGGQNCENRDFCSPNRCRPGWDCKPFPPENPTQHMCCDRTRAICEECPAECDNLMNDGICQSQCYKKDCKRDQQDCDRSLSNAPDSWSLCPEPRCRSLFNNGYCDEDCNIAPCNYDGMDCISRSDTTCPYDSYCKTYFNNGLCDQGCNSSSCMWDGSDCLTPSSSSLSPSSLTITVDVSCDEVNTFSVKSQLARLLDTWTRAVTLLDGFESRGEGRQCDVSVSFDNRYCGADCRTANVTVVKNYLWAMVNTAGTSDIFPYAVVDMDDSNNSDKSTSNPQQISTAIIATIAVVGMVFLVIAVLVGRNVMRARARLWEPDGFKTARKRNIKDISKMGGPLQLKTVPKMGEQHNFSYYFPDQAHLMEVDLGPMFNMNRKRYEEGDESAPMITQAAYELRQRDETASPTTQAEEQIAIGRPGFRMELGRGETQLHAICRNKKSDELKRLLAAGNIDINVTDSMGRTPLYSAVGSGAVEVVDILLELEGIDVDKSINHLGSTPLILATKMVYNSIVEKLLKSRAQVNAADSSGKTALHWAAAVSNVHALELLLQYGANKDAENQKKETPLFLASREGKLEAVKVLILHNAQRHMADCMDQTPLHVARDHLHHDIEQVLLTWNTDGSSSLKHQLVHPGSLTPPQSDDAGSPNSIPGAMSPLEKEEKKSNKRKKKKTEQASSQPHNPPMYQTGYWAKNQLHSPPNWASTQMLSPESLTGSPTSNAAVPTTMEQPVGGESQRLTHFPLHGYPMDQSYIPHDHLLSRPTNRPYSHIPGHPIDYHSPESPEEHHWQITSPPHSDWSHTSP